MKVSYAQNLLSSVNIVLRIMREDDSIEVSPSALVGKRTTVKGNAPVTLDRERFERIVEDLREARLRHAATVIELARNLGLRTREAALLDCKSALVEAEFGKIGVVRGTKGGRGQHVERLVPVSESARACLVRAAGLQGDANNIIPAEKSWITFERNIRNKRTRDLLAGHGLRGYHDCRAAYACARYRELTEYPAPVVAGVRPAPKDVDAGARRTLALELGHGRDAILRAYIGSAR